VVVTPILRLGDYDISVPGKLALLHCEDFRDDANYASALGKLVANLKRPNPKLGALFAVPNLPPHFLGRPDLMRRVRDALLVDLQKPQVITGADAKVGMQGMGGIGKSVLAAALARNREVRQSYPDGIAWIACGQNLTDDVLLAQLAVFDTDGTVPEAAAAVLWAHSGQLDDLDTEDLLVNLFERSLIQLDQKPGADGKTIRRFRLHDLLHDYAVRIAGDAKALHQTLLDAYRAKCLDGWHTGPNDGYFLGLTKGQV
jgi:hypothetical protein